MVANSIPYFHNNPGVPRVRVRAKEFMCVGDLPPFDHPHIFIDMGDDNEIVCPYCSTLFAYDPHLEAMCEPAECEFHPEILPEPVPPPSDISIETAPSRPEFITPARSQVSDAAMSVETMSDGLMREEAMERDAINKRLGIIAAIIAAASLIIAFKFAYNEVVGK